jgi:hypothetical protein
LRVRADHLRDEFDFKSGGQKGLTVDELKSLQMIAPIRA